MVCQNCSSDNPDGQAFCGKCGQPLIAENISERLARLERRNKITQENLELETAVNVMEKVRKWTTLIFYFAGIPAALGLLALAVMFGKGSFDMYRIAASAKTSVGAVLTQAQSQASDADRVASGALATANQVYTKVRETQASVSKLKSEVEARSADVQTLSGALKSSRDQLQALTNRMAAQEAEVHRVTRQVQVIQTAQSVADVQAVYPIYGEHIARNSNGFIDPKAKPPGALYLDINLSLTQTPNVSDAMVGEAIGALKDHKYTVTIGSVYMESRTASGSAQNVGFAFDSGSCTYWAQPEARPPCILYFRESLKDHAIEVRNLVKGAQEVPDNRIIYVDPTKLGILQRELLEKSATDFVVILGQ